MLHYLHKRLLITLPVLWFLATLIFILSRQLPGTFASENIFSTGDESLLKSNRGPGGQQAYQDYLRKTGLDLPVFYFSIATKAEPDTLYRIYPETERQHLKELSWRYGHWPSVAAYHKQLEQLQQHLSPAQLQAGTPALYTLQTTVDKEAILTALQKLNRELPGNRYVAGLTTYARAMTALEGNHTYLIPSLQWHGSSNQYHRWVTGILEGDWGRSYRDNRPVQEIVLEAFSNTLPVVLASMFLVILLALAISVFLMKKPTGNFRKVILSFLFTLDSIPLFLLCLLLLLLFANAAVLQLFPSYGMGYNSFASSSWWEQLSTKAHYMFLPVTCLTLCNLPYLTNQFYRAMADAAATDYVRTAKAKGLSGGKVIRRHIFRNALLPIITLLSDFIPFLVAGAVITETVFAIPGMGHLLVTSVQARDYPVIVAVVLVVTVVKVVSFLAADICYALADPRIRFEK